MTELICIVCPKGCHLKVDEKNEYSVTGNSCARGEAYGKAELKNPTRVVTSTVRISGGLHKRCPVKTNGTIPKGLVFTAVRLLDQVDLKSPVKADQIIVENVLGTGVNFITSRNM